MKIEIGTKLGKLTIIEYLKNDKYRYKCDCGNEGIRRGCSILKTKYPTCGCGISEGVQKRKLETIKGAIKNNQENAAYLLCANVLNVITLLKFDMTL